MQLKHSNADPLNAGTGCLILPVGNRKKLTGTIALADTGSDKYLSKILKKNDLADSVGATLMLHNVPGLKAQRVLLVSAGSSKKITAQQFDQITRATATALSTPAIKDCVSCLNDIEVENKDLTWQSRSFAQALVVNDYTFDLHKSEKTKNSAKFNGKATLFVSQKSMNKAVETGIVQGLSLIHI